MSTFKNVRFNFASNSNDNDVLNHTTHCAIFNSISKVERFLRRVSRVNSTTNDELQTTVESILSHDPRSTSPRRPTRSRLNSSSENVPMNDLRNTSVGSLTPTRTARVINMNWDKNSCINLHFYIAIVH